MEENGAAVIVVDTNVICYYWIRSRESALAEQALTQDPHWIAPILWRSEFRNALTLLHRQKIITLGLALKISEEAERQFAAREYSISSRTVLELTALSSCSAYDCEFVALAQEQRVKLVTADRQVLRQFPAVAISLEAFVRA